MPSVEHFHVNKALGGWRLPLRWAALVLILAAELLGLSFRFDTASLSGDDSWWTQLAGNIPQLLRAGLAFIGALVLQLAPRWRENIGTIRQVAADYPWLRYLALHLAVFVAFFWATLALFGSAEREHHLAGLAVAAWFCLGVTSCLLWLGTVAPPRYWRDLARRERGPLVIAALAGTLAWLLGLAAQQFWKPLAEGTFWLAYELLSLHYPLVVFELSSFSLGTVDFSVRINQQCSGYEGIGLITVFLALYLWLFRSEVRFPHALLLFPIGGLAIWLANGLRIALLIALGSSYSPAVALGGFHSQAGWISFILIALALIFAMRRLRLFAKTEALTAATLPAIVPALLVPFLALMAAIMLTSAFSAGFDRFYGLRVVATGIALWQFRRIYLRWDWRPSWQAVAVGALVFGLWLALEPSNNGAHSTLGQTMATLSTGEKSLWLVLRVVGSVLLVPLVEELAFRGYLLRRLAGQEGDDLAPGRFAWWPFLASSLAFGLLHSRPMAGVLAGMAYALIYYHRGRLADAVAAHATSNGLIALMVLIGGRWELWS